MTQVHTPETSKNITQADLAKASPDSGHRDPGPRHLISTGPGPGKRLRILLVLEAAGGGAGRHVLDLARGLLRRNHNVCLAWSPDRADPRFSDALETLNDLSIHPLPMRRSVGPADIGHARELRKLIDRLGPFDIVHAHSSKAGALLRLALLRSSMPRVYTPHAFITLDPELNPVARGIYTAAEWLLARTGGLIICVSEHERRHALKLGIPPEQLTVVHNGIEPQDPVERHSVRKELGLDEGTLCIGTVGRLSHQKAIERLISAYAISQAAQQNSALVIVGSGEDQARLVQQVANLGLKGKVRLTGPGDGPRLMAGFDVFALSSRYEACPYVLLEAVDRGLPVVMTDTGGAGSIIIDGHNGYVVSQDDLEAFASRLGRLAADTGLRRRMSAAALEQASRYSLDEMVELTLRAYAQAMEQSIQ